MRAPRSAAAFRIGNAWPLPALLAWAACWALFAALRATGAPVAVAGALAAVLGAVLAIAGRTSWRRVCIGAGFPLSLAASGLVGTLPGWAWLAPLALLALLYPIRSWRDAPVFPTPRGALAGLAEQLGLPADARILDAGCGAGDALRELRREFPTAHLSGIESSRPLALISRWRCPSAAVRRGDMWLADWSDYDLVYLFQRPESMARAAAKAGRQLRPGAWLASLEFEVAAWRPTWLRICPDGRALWLYRAPFVADG